MNPRTPVDLAHVQRLCDAATPGPWEAKEDEAGRGAEFWVSVPGQQTAHLFLDATPSKAGNGNFERSIAVAC